MMATRSAAGGPTGCKRHLDGRTGRNYGTIGEQVVWNKEPPFQTVIRNWVPINRLLDLALGVEV